jgi:hypothetical protein
MLALPSTPVVLLPPMTIIRPSGNVSRWLWIRLVAMLPVAFHTPGGSAGTAGVVQVKSATTSRPMFENTAVLRLYIAASLRYQSERHEVHKLNENAKHENILLIKLVHSLASEHRCRSFSVTC